jgi:hypothetical protein
LIFIEFLNKIGCLLYKIVGSFVVGAERYECPESDASAENGLFRRCLPNNPILQPFPVQSIREKVVEHSNCAPKECGTAAKAQQQNQRHKQGKLQGKHKSVFFGKMN